MTAASSLLKRSGPLSSLNDFSLPEARDDRCDLGELIDFLLGDIDFSLMDDLREIVLCCLIVP